MAKKGNVRRISDKRKNKPKIRFNMWMLITIFALSFMGCFVLYMVAANIDDDFFDEQFSTVVAESESENANDEDESDVEDSSEPAESSIQESIINPVPASETVDISYLEKSCLVTDSTLLGMGDSGFSDIIGSEELNAASVGTTKIASSYGTVTVYETLKIKKPVSVYIMLGSDIGVSDTDSMISAYMALVSNLKTALPSMKIYIMQLPPASGDSAKNELINDYNTRLLSMADSMGVYCIDTNTELKDNEGNLSSEYYDAESGTVNDAYYNQIIGYILTHTA